MSKQQLTDEWLKEYIDNFPIKDLLKDVYFEDGAPRFVLKDGSDVSYELMQMMIFSFERGELNA
ncbi:hypothetical protein ACOLYJ_002482 [Listeria monocytogenes]